MAMRDQRVVRLAEGTIISSWPASTDGGGEIYLPVVPPYEVPDTARYLVDTDSVARTVHFRRCADRGAAAS
jgi:hypothetical protein